MLTRVRATIDDLYRVEGKAELVDGEIMSMPPTGDEPGRAGGGVYASLRQYERATRTGYAYPDNVGFKVDLPRRESFSPDAAYYTGPRSGMKLLNGPPAFAVEIRSENSYGPVAEQEMANKRADYFAAGTSVVWDVDLLGRDVVRKYASDSPDNPVLFRRGEIADAEPAVLGWRYPVDELFE